MYFIFLPNDFMQNLAQRFFFHSKKKVLTFWVFKIMLQIFHENHCLFQYLLFICFDFLVLMYLRTNLFVFLVKLCKIPIEIRVEIYFRFKKSKQSNMCVFFVLFFHLFVNVKYIALPKVPIRVQPAAQEHHPKKKPVKLALVIEFLLSHFILNFRHMKCFEYNTKSRNMAPTSCFFY